MVEPLLKRTGRTSGDEYTILVLSLNQTNVLVIYIFEYIVSIYCLCMHKSHFYYASYNLCDASFHGGCLIVTINFVTSQIYRVFVVNCRRWSLECICMCLCTLHSVWIVSFAKMMDRMHSIALHIYIFHTSVDKHSLKQDHCYHRSYQTCLNNNFKCVHCICTFNLLKF